MILIYLPSRAYHLKSIFNINIQVHWIPGHTSNSFNDRADQLAKQGASSSSSFHHYTLVSGADAPCEQSQRT